MKISPTIFRLYDIRGVAGQDFSPAEIAEFEKFYGPFPGVNITPAVARAIGQAYGTFMRRQHDAKKILVGREERPFAEELKNSFIDGILSTGCDVDDAGIALTPIVYFADCFYKYDGAVNITGSHNIYFYNGFKMMAAGAQPVFDQDLQQLRVLIEKEDFEAAAKGRLGQREIYQDYENYIKQQVQLARPLKIVIDTGNGSAGLFAEKFYQALGCEVISIYKEVDARFPNHIPDPEDKSHVVELGAAVREHGADLGLGLDADGDRMGAVNEKGEYIDSDLIVLLLAIDVLKRNPGKKILYDVKLSRLLDQVIKANGGVPLMHMTGHAPIKNTLRQDHDIILGGEKSGHIYFVENYFRIDDGLYAGAQLLKLVAASNQPISQMVDGFHKTVRTSEFKLPCDDTIKFDVVTKIKERFAQDYKIIELDGVRVIFDETSWALVRASNTSPQLTLRLEAETVERLLEIKNIIADELEKHSGIKDKLDRTAVESHTGKLGWV